MVCQAYVHRVSRYERVIMFKVHLVGLVCEGSISSHRLNSVQFINIHGMLLVHDWIPSRPLAYDFFPICNLSLIFCPMPGLPEDSGASSSFSTWPAPGV